MFAAILEPRIEKVTIENAPRSYTAMVQMRVFRVDELADGVIPGVLLDFDLPDIRKALGGA